MQKTLLYKFLWIGGLMLLLGLPLMMIESTIGERMHFHDDAVKSIASDSVGEQTVVGPLLVIPYDEEIDGSSAPDADGKTKPVHQLLHRRQLVFPDQLKITGRIDTERRYRGIHQVLMFRGQHALSGEFTWPQQSELQREGPASRITVGRPYVALSVADVRGISDIPKLNWGGVTFEFEQGALLRAAPDGMHAQLEPVDWRPGQRVPFSFSLGLAGIERQHFVPVAKNNWVAMTSNWPHPLFDGRFLPEQHAISGAGFSAVWRVSALASGAQRQLARLETGEDVHVAGGLAAVDSFNVGFIEPVNIYVQADRATKYGVLFVALTFAAFFVFEIVKRLSIHPVQYLLVGLALALFFLLLVGLSEHIAFVVAYVIASVACIVLIAYYLSHVLGDRLRGAGFGAGLVLLYSALYGLLVSENNALVLGSVLLFTVLAALMIATRKVNWYQINDEA